MNVSIKEGQLLPSLGSRKRLPILFLSLLLLFSVQQAIASDLYWVGGSGNWNDLSHWSLTSGNSGGLLSPSIPQASDHVIFDSNSGFIQTKKEVFINSEASCKDLTIKDVEFPPVFNGMRLNVYGSANIQAKTVLNSNIYFRGAGAEEISFNNMVSGSASFFFIGKGSYNLSGSVAISGGIYFLQGSLDLGSSQINAGFFDEGACCGLIPFPSVNNRTLDLGSSTIILNGRNSQSNTNAPTWAYTGETLISGTSVINIKTSVADGYGVRFLGGDKQSYHHVIFSSPDKGLKDSTPYQWYQIEQGKCLFRKLTFASDGYISSNITVDSLVLAKSARYYLYGQQTFSNIQNPTDLCDPSWSLTGIGGLQAVIHLTNPIKLKNCRLSFVKVTGAEMSVENGVDAGNNESIIFSTSSKDLYWIGGGGNWNDPSHWTTNPDGTPSGGCLPSRNDNVFFGSYSGVITTDNPVTINVENAECHSIAWESVAGFPAFVSAKPQYSLSIFGSSTWQRNMDYRIANTAYLGSSQNNVIRSNAVIIQGDARLEGDGKWTLADAFESDGDLTFLSGTFETNGKSLNVKNFGANSGGTGKRFLNIENSILNVAGIWSYMNFGGPSIDVLANNSTIRMLGKDALFRYNSGLTYSNIRFENQDGAAALQAETYSDKRPCYFDSLVFRGNARINVSGSPTPLHIRNLSFAAGKAYTLGTNMPISIGEVTADADCKGMGILRSEAAGTQANLVFAESQSLSRFQVSDLKCSDQQLIVIDGIDGGNNTNVRIEAATGKSLYWIGGDGSWSDLNHWSYDSLGMATVVSCLPTVLDHVHFNKYSGKDYQVNLDIPAVCGDMTWDYVANSRPGLIGKSLSINGSLTLQRGMNLNVERVQFVGTGQKEITTNGVVLDYSAPNYSERGLFFNSYGGSWKLLDSLKAKNIGLINGTLFTNGKSVSAENWISEYINDQKIAKLRLDSSTLIIAGYWDASGIDSLDAGKSSIVMVGTMPQSNESGNGLYTNQFRSRADHYYNIVQFSNPSMDAKVIAPGYDKGYSFNSISFSGPASLNSSNQIQSLTTAKDLHLWSGTTQQIDQWITTSDCQQWDLDNNCMSPDDGCRLSQKAKIITNFPMTLNNVRISGIEISGPSDQTAFGSDMGNNSGWTFLPANGRTLYWIGGDGSYADAAHWTTNSDGTASGNRCSPGQHDNVVFNPYSGADANISVQGLAECKDMTWMDVPGKPVFNGLINCYGSLTLQTSLTHYGGINFLSTGQEIIKTNDAVVARNYDVNFSGGGTYLFMDDFSTDSHLNITKGELNTNGKTVKALSLNGIESSPQESGKISLVLGNSKIYLSYYSAGWQYTATRLDAGNSHIYLRGNANIFRAKDGAKYHRVTFDTTPNTLHQVYGSFTVDSMVFARKNSTYELESSKTITVNEQLSMSGNPCATVSVRASLADEQVNLKVLRGDTTYNFIALSQINATGRKLLMLEESADLGFNSNISFKAKSVYGIGLLGPDQKICPEKFPITLSAQSFLPDKFTRIEWKELRNQQIIGGAVDLIIDHAGTYAITVAYDQECVITDTINISIDTVNHFAKFIQIKHPSCSQPYGSVQLPSGFSYSVDGAPFSGQLFYQLSSGIHFVLARSPNDCVSDTVQVIIKPQPSKPTASIRFPVTETKATGKLKVVLSGTQGGIFSAKPNGLTIDSLTGTVNLSNSEPDKYYLITYRVGSGDCAIADSTSLHITETPTTISFPLPDYCAVGSIAVHMKGIQGGTYQAIPAGLSIDLHNGLINLDQSLQGQYKVYYTYYDGTLKKSVETYIKINPLPVINIFSDKTTIVEGESLRLSASGGLTYGWLGDHILSASNESSIYVRPMKTTTYRVLVANQNGCTRSADITIHVRKALKPIPNNVITPNGDGKNDYWIIANIEDYPNNTVKIFDRAGRLIYSKIAYKNEWDGRLNGNVLNEDGYIYILDPGNGKAFMRGTVSVVLNASNKQ